MLGRFLIKIVEPFADNRRLLAVWIIFIAFFMGMSWLDNQLQAMGDGVGMLDLQFAYTAERAADILQRWGETGRAFALQCLIVDCIYPLSYGLALMALTLKVYGPDNRWRRAVVYLPFWAMLLDYAENYVHWQVIQAFPMLHSSRVELASLYATTKWVLVGLTALVIVGGLIRNRAVFSAEEVA